jgi:hypothetical protein
LGRCLEFVCLLGGEGTFSVRVLGGLGAVLLTACGSKLVLELLDDALSTSFFLNSVNNPAR